ncbi:hypothetical protein [Solibacillus sp. FSL K6-1523]|uniref:hypothetical protein n=1 Tax=Solibacillus sp. FSL K6-1523 TaxID=2921471 RepID=UPI0030F757E0
MKVSEFEKLSFAPFSDECTTFENVRVVRFQEGMVGVVMNNGLGEKIVFTNTKPFAIYYDTTSSKILNVLQIVRFESDKMKIKHSLKEMLELSDIEKRLKIWIEHSLEVPA